MGNDGRGALNETLHGRGADIIHCQAYRLVQYRTRIGKCRRCTRPLYISAVTLSRVATSATGLSDEYRQGLIKRTNIAAVAVVGKHIRRLRMSRNVTQAELHVLAGISRSYISQLELGLLTPGIGTLEKLSDALGFTVADFLVSEVAGEVVLDDPFIRDLRPYIPRQTGHKNNSF